MSHTLLEPEITDAGLKAGRWMVVIFNNDHTPFDLVIATVMRATGCDLREAMTEAWEAHTFGKAPVHFSTREECESAAAIIDAIGVKTEVAPEWAD